MMTQTHAARRTPAGRSARAALTGMTMLSAACGLLAMQPQVAQAAQAASTPTLDAQEVVRLRAQLEAQMKVSQAIQARLDALEARETADAKAQVEAGKTLAEQAANQAKTIADLKTNGGENGSFTMAGGRPTFTAFGGKGSLQIGLQAQFDAGTYMESNTSVRRSGVDLGDGVNARRIRIPFVFKYGDFVANVTPDFGGSPDGRQNSQYLYEANLNYTPSQVKGLTLSVGYLQPNISLLDASSSNDFLFMERPAIMDLERNIAAGDARASVGAKYFQDQFFVSAYLTGQAYGGQSTYTSTGSTTKASNGQQTAAVVRLAGRPYYDADTDVHVGFSGTEVFSLNQTGSATDSFSLSVQPELRVDTNKLINTGAISGADGVYTWNPELAVRYKNFLLMGEYVDIGVLRSQGPGLNRPALNFTGAYADASWVITGETRQYQTSRGGFGGVKPDHPFNLDTGDLGAFELAARYSETDLNDHVQRFTAASSLGGNAGGQQNIIQIGLNWYPNEHLKFMTDYQFVDVSKLGGATLQNQTGLRYQSIGFRAQVAY